MNLSELLEPIASQFRAMGIPEPIVHWGHPLMMGIVVVVMGSVAGITGWRGRLLTQTEPDAAIKNRSDHSKIAPLMFLFMALGYTGGLLSLVMQHHNVLESPHFWTGSLVLILLALNGLISATKFGGNQAALRTAHAYLGSLALVVMFLHAVLGLQLGFSIWSRLFPAIAVAMYGRSMPAGNLIFQRQLIYRNASPVGKVLPILRGLTLNFSI